MTGIKAFTPQLAIETARDMFWLIYGVQLTEKDFVELVAKELYAVARMENQASLEIARGFGLLDVLLALQARYETEPGTPELKEEPPLRLRYPSLPRRSV